MNDSRPNVYGVSRSVWDDPDFADEPYTEREAWLWLATCGPMRNHPRPLAEVWGWSETRASNFVRKMFACGLFVEIGDDLYAVSPDKAERHPEYITGESWLDLRLRVFVRDHFECVYCGSRENLHCDHVIPRARGGLDVIGNLVAACGHCNCSKGAKLLEEWKP